MRARDDDVASSKRSGRASARAAPSRSGQGSV